MTAEDYNMNGFTRDNYWAYIQFSYYSSITLKITYWRDVTYLKGMSIHILLVNTEATFKYTVAETGGSASY